MKMNAKTQLTYPDNSTLTYTYDTAGNRLTGPKDKLTYTSNQANQLTQSLQAQGEAASYQYDNNGNLIKKTERDDDRETKTTTYTYDYENRLIKVAKQEQDETKTRTFKYDPFGRRIEKKIEETEDNETETKVYTYLYDNEDIILEYLTKTDDNETKTETTRYIHGTGIDEPLAIVRKGEIYYYHADGLGSITALTDKKQKIVESYTYTSFGEVKRQGDKVKNTFTYTGREWDKEVGLYYYRRRYYDPVIGRFLSRDPVTWGPDDPRILFRRNEMAARVAGLGSNRSRSGIQQVNPPSFSQGNPSDFELSVQNPFLSDKAFSKLLQTFGNKWPQLQHPYTYAVNNPVNFIDPSGQLVRIIQDENGNIIVIPFTSPLTPIVLTPEGQLFICGPNGVCTQLFGPEEPKPEICPSKPGA